jgi:magnesium-protoporphyrin O-methyltransferase
MNEIAYQQRRSEIETYFDRTAAQAWATLTSAAPVSGIRATVRAGRERTRENLLSWLPSDLRGQRVLDAGCGTGALAVEAARRGAQVTAIDLSATLIALARDRMPSDLAGAIDWRCGDMLDPALGTFDHIVGMDSLIHYERAEVVNALAQLAPRTLRSIVFTFPPRTPALVTLRWVGRLFPRGDRSPAIVPLAEQALKRYLLAALPRWQLGRGERVSTAFYKSHALELLAPPTADALGR